MAPPIHFAITGDNKSFISALNESKAALLEAKTEISEGFETISGTFEKLTGALGVLTGALAGGAVFKEALEAMTELEGGSAKLGNQFGVSATQASILRVALDQNRVTQEQFQTAGNALVRTLRTNEDAIRSLGVETRDSATGGFRPLLEIMFDVNETLQGTQAGINRNIAGQTAYGRAWAENARVIKITEQSMESAKEEAESLGLVVSKQSQENFNQYRDAMNKIKLAMSAVWNAIGQQLMPTLTRFANFFAEFGPNIVTGFSAAMATVISLFEGLNLAANITWDTLSMTFNGIFQLLSGFANAIAALIPKIDWKNKTVSFDLAGAKAAFMKGWNDMQRIGQEGTAKIIADSEAANERITRAWQMATGTLKSDAAPAPQEGGEAPDPAAKDNMAKWQAQLEEFKANLAERSAAIGEFHEVTKAQEGAYWQAILDTQKTTSKEQFEIRKIIAADAVATAKEAFEGELAYMKAAEAAQRQNLEAKLVIARAYQAAVEKAYGASSPQAAKAAQEIIAIEEAKTQQEIQLDQIAQQTAQRKDLAIVDSDQAAAEAQLAAGRITRAELLNMEQSFEQRRHAIREAALQADLTMVDPQRDPVKYAQVNAQIEAEESQHQLALNKIRAQSFVESHKYIKGFQDATASSWAQTITKMAEGTESFSEGWKDLVRGMADAFIQAIAQMAAQWAAQQLINLVLGQTTAESQIAAAAGVAGAQGTASFAGAPWPIDMGAPAFGAAMAATAASFAVAERGYDVPKGINPMTQLHSEEMVLPRAYADVIRDMAGQSPGDRGSPYGGGNAPSQSHTLNFTPAGNGMVLVHAGNLMEVLRKTGLQFKMPSMSGARTGAGLP